MSWNLSLFWDINHFAAHSEWAHGFMAPFALWGGLVLIVVILAVAWWRSRLRLEPGRASAATILTGVASIVALGLNQVAAGFHHETRPFLAQHGVTVLLKHSADNSFPSDHASIAGALAVGILLFAPRWGVVASIVALFLAFARVYAGMHYPGDVIAGLVIGAVVALVLVGGLTRVATTLLRRVTPGALEPLLATTPSNAAAEPASGQDQAANPARQARGPRSPR